MADYNDHRVYDLAEPIAWGVATDRFMSRSRMILTRSCIAYPLYSSEDMDAFEEYAATRSDFMRPRGRPNRWGHAVWGGQRGLSVNRQYGAGGPGYGFAQGGR